MFGWIFGPPDLMETKGRRASVDLMDEIGQLYGQVGETRLREMVTAFYQKVRVDDLIGPMYPDQDWEGAEKRLADFIVYRFGGPQTYLEERGHPRLRGRHMPFAIGEAERDQARLEGRARLGAGGGLRGQGL
jgi:truncated hemoglobin YjbI